MGNATQGQRGIARAVPHRHAVKHRYTQICRALRQHLLHGPLAVGRRFVKAAKGKTRQLLERTAEPPVGEHPVDAVGGLTHVFKHRNGAFQRRQVGRAQQMGGHREVAHQQRAGAAAPVQALPPQGIGRTAEEELLKPLLAPRGFAGDGGEQRPMNSARCAAGLLAPQEAGAIGKAQQPPRNGLPAPLQQTGRPPAAAGAGPEAATASRGWRPLKIRQPLRVFAGKAAPLPQGLVVTINHEPPAAQHGDACLQRICRREGRTGQHHHGAITGLQQRQATGSTFTTRNRHPADQPANGTRKSISWCGPRAPKRVSRKQIATRAMTSATSLSLMQTLLQRLLAATVYPFLAGTRYPFRFTSAFLSQLLRFKPGRPTPGSYAVEQTGRWIRQFMAFFPAVYHFMVRWGKQRPRFLNVITVMAPVSACLAYLFLTIFDASFVNSFLQLHFPDQLDTSAVRLPAL